MNSETFANAIMQLAAAQQQTAQQIEALCGRIDLLTSIVVNDQKTGSGPYRGREQWPQTIVGVVILALVILGLILGKVGCGSEPALFSSEQVDGGELDTDSGGELDTDSGGELDTDSGGELDTDSGGELDTDSGGELDTDTSDTSDSCPWVCAPIATPSGFTCDPDWDLTGRPAAIRNYNFVCPSGQWCCQPYPPGDEQGISTPCEEDTTSRVCLLECKADQQDLTRFCDHPAMGCCWESAP